MPKNIATKEIQRKKRRDKPGKVKQANKKMREAWELGTELIDELGMFSEYGAMRDRAKKDHSLAEKYRKYRGMADRLTEKELRDICDLCEKEEKGWGPTFLVELSRIRTARERRLVAKKAILNRWGLIELKRQIRLIVGTNKKYNVSADEKVRVGRKRFIDWTSEAQILDELNQLCLGWVHFTNDLQNNSRSGGVLSGLEKLPSKLRKELLEVSANIILLQRSMNQRIDQQAGKKVNG